MDNVVNKNKKYYLALVNDEKQSVEIRMNNKNTREYFKSKLTDNCRVFKLRGQNVQDCYDEFTKYIGADYELIVTRNRIEPPIIEPFEL